MTLDNWRACFAVEGKAWAIEDAQGLYQTSVDNKDLDLQMLGFDAGSAAIVYHALEWLHAEVYAEELDRWF